MIKIILPKHIELQMKQELEVAGNREIGGILMGEHISKNAFRITKISVQRHSGTIITFIRDVKESLQSLMEFFSRTNHQYKQYNYLGEWHSHPSFDLLPSIQDQQSMFDIVNDKKVGANFAVILLVKLNGGYFKGNISLFLSGYPMLHGTLEREG